MNKVCIMTSGAFFSGAERMPCNLATARLIQDNFELVLVRPKSSQYATKMFRLYPSIRLIPQEEFKRIDPVLFPDSGKNVFLKIVRFTFFLPAYVFSLVVLFVRFSKMLRRLRPNIVYVNNGGYPGSIEARMFAICSKLHGSSLILMVINNIARDYHHYSRWPDFILDKFVVRSVDLFITGSQTAAQKLRQVLRLSSEAVISIPNGIRERALLDTLFSVEPNIDHIPRDAKIVGSVGLLEKRKGHIYFLEAIDILTNDLNVNLDNVFFLIEGSGPEKSYLSEEIRRRNLDSKVNLVEVSGDIYGFIERFYVLVHPSIADEDFPNIVLESMMLGVPVVASSIAGTMEQIVNGLTGLLVQPRNAVELSQAIRKILLNSELRNSMASEASRRFYEEFTLEKCIEKYFEIIEEFAK